jgi:hypothetical protein
MIRALALAVALLLAPVAAAAQTLTVTNGEGKVTTFTAQALAELPRGKATLAGKTAYEGVDLVSVLREAAVPLGPRLHGKPLVAYVVVSGKDGYRAVFSIAELDPAFRPGAAILADRRVGAPLEENEGPWRLVVEADAKAGRSVRQVELITMTVLP